MDKLTYMKEHEYSCSEGCFDTCANRGTRECSAVRAIKCLGGTCSWYDYTDYPPELDDLDDR
jgi:hypothetical protein